MVHFDHVGLFEFVRLLRTTCSNDDFGRVSEDMALAFAFCK
jgi:hypothetical protein